MATGAAPKKSLFKRRAGPVIAQKTAEPNTPSNTTTTSTPSNYPSATTIGMSTVINPFVTGSDSSPPIPAPDDPGIGLFRRAKHFFPKTIKASLREEKTQAQTTLQKGSGADSHDLKRRKVSSEQDSEAIRSRSSSSPQHDAHDVSSQVDLHDNISSSSLSRRDKGKGIATQHTVNDGITFINSPNPRKRASSEVEAKVDETTQADDSVILVDDSDSEDVKPLPQRPRKDSWEEDEDTAPKSKGILKGIAERIKAGNINCDDVMEVIDPEFEEYIIRARAQNAASRAAKELQEINAQLSAKAGIGAYDVEASFDSQTTASSAVTAVPSDSQPGPPGEQSYRIFITSRLPEQVPPLIANVRMDQEMRAVKNAFISHAREKGYEMTPEVSGTVLLTWKGSKIYDFTTGLSLKLQPDAKGRFRRTNALDNLSSLTEQVSNGSHKVSQGFVSGGLHVEIWTEETYEKYVQDQEKQRRRNMGETLEEDLMSDDEGGNTQDEVSKQELKREGSMANGGNRPQSQQAQDKIRLVLTSRDHEKLNVTAHSDTAIGTLIRAFRLQLSIPDDKIVTIRMDGEKLEEDSTVGDADMDDMDSVEVHIN